MPPHTWLETATATVRLPELKPAHLRGAFQFWDGQMDDRQLGHWVAAQNRLAGAVIHEQTPITAVTTDGRLRLATRAECHYNHLINAAGPWARHLLHRSQIPSSQDLDLIRGSHLILDRPCPNAYLLEVRDDHRIFFVLPWQQGTLVGTTEVREDHPPGVAPPAPQPSAAEIDYLLTAYNHYFIQPASRDDIRATFAGLRPLVKSAADPSRATREYVLERHDRLTTVFGGKWTTAARKVRQQVEQP